MLYFLYPFLRKELIFLDYVIRNNAGIYIQLDKDGRPVTFALKEIPSRVRTKTKQNPIKII